ncbi:Heparan-sulfate 6-O-sulfotransferase 1-A [Eumeta japonica]|uniref:Heparan-sulfate 6-O-sulfotransferase n=1 Tax=Eumeta variegata TaxID=151549 RepID=A0A4C1ZQM3_EUMVA|nr:Heparan-sulfate 6-O-sulfotransferase 1-A [Eumeta japonica]
MTRITAIDGRLRRSPQLAAVWLTASARGRSTADQLQSYRIDQRAAADRAPTVRAVLPYVRFLRTSPDEEVAVISECDPQRRPSGRSAKRVRGSLCSRSREPSTDIHDRRNEASPSHDPLDLQPFRAVIYRRNASERRRRDGSVAACGLHADFTELTACVGGELDRHEGTAVHRRYFYITLLREPVARYLSEYRHVKRGATWKGSRHWCQGRTATAAEVPPCYTGESWRGVTLEQFAGCPWNLASNRQTRMLADLALVGCYNGTLRHRTSDTDRVLLASAKRNLAAMAYFGLTEYQKQEQNSRSGCGRSPLGRAHPLRAHRTRPSLHVTAHECQDYVPRRCDPNCLLNEPSATNGLWSWRALSGCRSGRERGVRCGRPAHAANKSGFKNDSCDSCDVKGRLKVMCRNHKSESDSDAKSPVFVKARPLSLALRAHVEADLDQ